MAETTKKRRPLKKGSIYHPGHNKCHQLTRWADARNMRGFAIMLGRKSGQMVFG